MPELSPEQTLEAIRRLVGGAPTRERWVTFPDAAAYLGITDRYLRELVRQRRLSVMRHTAGGLKYLDRAELDAYTEAAKQRRDVA